MRVQPSQSLPPQPDARADGGERHVALAQEEILIDRSMNGVRMRLRLPTRAYRGVALSLDETPTGRAIYRVSLWHNDRDFRITLQEALDDRDIVAQWKSWASYFGLPKFIERTPGQLEGAEIRLGQLAIGAARVQRRRGAAISKRRGRLPLRRKPGRADHRAAIVTGAQLGGYCERPEP